MKKIITVLFCFALTTLSAKTAKKFTNLGFNGLHLGMTYKDIHRLVKTSNWKYKYSRPKRGTKYVFLAGDKAFSRIGCARDGTCYTLKSTTLQFFEGKIIEFQLDSPRYSAAYIDTRIKSWARFALKGLTKKYGKPTKVIIPVDKINTHSFQSGFAVYLYEWGIGTEKINLAISTYELRYYCNIIFEDLWE